MNFLYFFAHHALRVPIVRNEVSLDSVLSDPVAATAWISSAAAATAQVAGLTGDQVSKLIGAVALERVTIAGRPAIVLRMPPPRNPTECHFVAVFQRPDGDLRYCTLERSIVPDRSMLCAWVENGHALIDSVPKPDLQSFIAAIEQAEARV